jgi:hypothetical protein
MDKAGLIPESSDPDLFIPATKSIPRPSVQNNNIIVLDSDEEDDEDGENYPDQNYEDDVDAMMTEEKGDDEEISSLNVEIKSIDNEIASLVALRSSLRTKLASAKSRQSDRTASSSTLAVKSNTSKKVLKLLVLVLHHTCIVLTLASMQLLTQVEDTAIDYSRGSYEWSDRMKVVMKQVWGIDAFRLCQLGVINATLVYPINHSFYKLVPHK